MSVYIFKPKEIASIIHKVKETPRLRWIFEYKYSEEMKRHPDPEEFINMQIAYFFNRLYMANQIAYYYSYPDEMENGKFIVGTLEEEDLRKREILSYRELLTKLELLRYNLISNSGRKFYGKEDEETLNQLIDSTKDILIEQLDRYLEYKDLKVFE